MYIYPKRVSHSKLNPVTFVSTKFERDISTITKPPNKIGILLNVNGKVTLAIVIPPQQTIKFVLNSQVKVL